MNNIAIIEDSSYARKAIRGMLKSGGFENIREAGNGEEGLKLCKKEDIELVLLDIKMPKMDGIEVLEKLQKSDKNLKIIMITSDRREGTMEKAMEKGADSYITKPLTRKIVLKEVKNLLNE